MRIYLLFLLIINVNYCYSFKFHSVYYHLHRLWDIIDIFNGFLTPYYETPEIGKDEKFDFIIIGGGSAGSVLANRLSENESWKVLLIEAGDAPNYIGDIMTLAGLMHFSKYNWGYRMEKQHNFGLGMEDQRLQWPRGKGLGGSSLINYCLYIRGNKLDYNNWGEKNPGWSYKDMFPYFLKAENAHLIDGDESHHSTKGPVHVQSPTYKTKSIDALLEAARQVGYKNVDYNGKSQIGFSLIQGSVYKGKRWSAEKAYLRPIRHRKNLKILTNSRVTEVGIDPTSKIAETVHYFHNGQYHAVKASKEIILSAGAFHSPQILMLSGVGPEQDLKNLDINPIKDLPVGKKLLDHIPFFGLVYTVKKPITYPVQKAINPFLIMRYLLTGKGPLSIIGGVVEGIGYMHTNLSQTNPQHPDIELLFIDISLAIDYGLMFRTSWGVSDHVYDNYFKPLQGKHAFQILPVLLHPKSFGNITLRSKSIFDAPKLYGNYLTDPDGSDIKQFIAAVRTAQKIARAPIWQEYGLEQYSALIPGCEEHEFDSDEYWECGIRQITATFHHQISTCKMGPDDDKEAVVDNRLKVKGIGQLRVADLSVVPITISAHTNAPAIILGERASDIIKEDWQNV